MSRDEMRSLTKDTLVPVSAVLLAVTLTIATMGYFSRKDRADQIELAELKARVLLLEADNRGMHAALDGASSKLDKLVDGVNDIKVRLGVGPTKSP